MLDVQVFRLNRNRRSDWARIGVQFHQNTHNNNTCTQHILDRETDNTEIILCPAAIAENSEQWFPFFDNKAKNVH